MALIRKVQKTASPKKKRGFASMDAATQRRICTMGGLAVSKDREHMSFIGRIGGIRRHPTTKSPAKTGRKRMV